MTDGIENARLIATIEKNKRETILVRRYTFQGHDVADFRIFRPEVKGGPPVRATRQGFAVRVDRLEKLRRALDDLIEDVAG